MINQRMIKSIIKISIWGMLLCACLSKGSCLFAQTDDRFARIYKQQILIQDGSALARQGQFDDAIIKFKRALQPDMLLHDYSDDVPVFLIARTLKLQRKYEEALKLLVPILNKYPDKESNWVDERKEIEALMVLRDTGSSKDIYAHINFLKQKNRKWLPPNPPTPTIIFVETTIFRLYDEIGDFDAGINFAEEFLKYQKSRGIDPYQPINHYFQMKRAFEQDKREGRKGATMQLILRSKHFTW